MERIKKEILREWHLNGCSRGNCMLMMDLSLPDPFCRKETPCLKKKKKKETKKGNLLSHIVLLWPLSGDNKFYLQSTKVLLFRLGINLGLSEIVANFLLSLKEQSSSWCLDLRKRAWFPFLNSSSLLKYLHRQRKWMLILGNKAGMPTGSFQPVLCTTGW